MLWFERDVVGALVTSSRPAVRSSVEAFVDGTLRDMAEWMRAGLAAESLLLGAYVALVRTHRPLDRHDLRDLLGGWETSRIGPLAQYVRAMRSLVLFAENELAAPDGDSDIATAGRMVGTARTTAAGQPVTGQPRGPA